MATYTNAEHQNPGTTTDHGNASPASQGGNGSLLIALGALAALGGAALAATPALSWQAEKVLAGFGNGWLPGATVCIGGLGVLSLGLVRRSLAAQARNTPPDTSLVLDQLATELVEMRTTLNDLGQQGEETAASIQALREELAQAQSAPTNGVSTEALFQLAASLDKLGHRIDQRLKLHHSTLHDSIEELTATVDHSRRTIEERVGRNGAHGSAAAHGPDDGWDLRTGGGREWAPAESAPSEPCTLASIDDARTLPNPGNWTGTGGESWELVGTHELEEPLAIDAPSSLGLLDTIHDDAVPAALPHIPVTNTLDFDSLDSNTEELARELDRASRAGQPQHHDAEAELGGKLHQLQSLLADPRLFAALQQMQQPK